MIVDKSVIDVMEKHLSSRSKVAVVFKVLTHNVVETQSNADYILDILCGCVLEDGEKVGDSFTIQLDKSIQLLKSCEGDSVKIQNMRDRIVFSKSSVVIPYPKAYDDIVDIPVNTLVSPGAVQSTNLESISRGFRKLVNVSKVLDKGVPSVIIYNGKSYCLYSNTMLISDVPRTLPDMEIPYNTFSNITKNLGSGSMDVYLDTNKKVLVLSSKNLRITTTYKVPGDSTITAIEGKVASLESLGDFTIDNLSTMEMVFKCFDKETVTVSFNQDGKLGFLLSVSDGKAITSGVREDTPKLNIVLSTAQIDSLYKVFALNTKVSILYGTDVVVFKTSGKQMIVSGMTFR